MNGTSNPKIRSVDIPILDKIFLVWKMDTY